MVTAVTDTPATTLDAVRDAMAEPTQQRARMKTMRTRNGSSYRVIAEQLEPIQCPADMAWLCDVLKVIPAAAPTCIMHSLTVARTLAADRVQSLSTRHKRQRPEAAAFRERDSGLVPRRGDEAVEHRRAPIRARAANPRPSEGPSRLRRVDEPEQRTRGCFGRRWA